MQRKNFFSTSLSFKRTPSSSMALYVLQVSHQGNFCLELSVKLKDYSSKSILITLLELFNSYNAIFAQVINILSF